MKRFGLLLPAVLLVGLLWNCSSNRFMSTEQPVTQASVRINLQDGSFREGIIVKGNSEELLYVDSKTHSREKLLFGDIKNILRISSYFDFEGHAIPVAEIKGHKNSSKKWLYGAGGLVLGVTVGTGVGIGLYAADQPLAANGSILLFGGLGAWFFGSKGNFIDYEEAAFAARKNRYLKTKSIRAEKRKIEELKKEKEKLLQQMKDKKKQDKGAE